MKKHNIIFMTTLLFTILTGCTAVTEESSDTANNGIEIQAESEKSTEMETKETTVAETEEITETETEKITEAETAPPTETETEISTEAETEIITETETAEVTESNTEPATEAPSEAEKLEVFALNGPLGRYQSPTEFGNATFAASFTEEDVVKMDDGTIVLNVMIYRYELFNGEKINALKKGDIIWCLGKKVVIDTIETTGSGAIVINGGIENGGHVFKTNDGTVYFESGMNDVKSYYEIGRNQYVLAADFVFTDNSDLSNSFTYTAEEFSEFEHGAAGFRKSNTIVKTSDNMITAIERNYIP